MNDMEFKLKLVEDILSTIRGCPHCETCSALCVQYFESIPDMNIDSEIVDSRQ